LWSQKEAALTESFFDGFPDFKKMISDVALRGPNIAMPYGMMNKEKVSSRSV